MSAGVSFLFRPINVFTSALFFPVVVSKFLCFLLGPLMELLRHCGIPEATTVLVVCTTIVNLMVLVVNGVTPLVDERIARLFGSLPKCTGAAESFIGSVSDARRFG